MKHYASPKFWAFYQALPTDVRGFADKNFALLKADSRYPSLHFKKVGNLWLVRVGAHHRALAAGGRVIREVARANAIVLDVRRVHGARVREPLALEREV